MEIFGNPNPYIRRGAVIVAVPILILISIFVLLAGPVFRSDYEGYWESVRRLAKEARSWFVDLFDNW